MKKQITKKEIKKETKNTKLSFLFSDIVAEDGTMGEWGCVIDIDRITRYHSDDTMYDLLVEKSSIGTQSYLSKSKS